MQRTPRIQHQHEHKHPAPTSNSTTLYNDQYQYNHEPDSRFLATQGSLHSSSMLFHWSKHSGSATGGRDHPAGVRRHPHPSGSALHIACIYIRPCFSSLPPVAIWMSQAQICPLRVALRCPWSVPLGTTYSLACFPTEPTAF